jgi:hypothetical protein
MVTLFWEVRHVPEAKANLFAVRRATDAGAKIVLEGTECSEDADNLTTGHVEDRNSGRAYGPSSTRTVQEGLNNGREADSKRGEEAGH